jgi:hypothetical protein
MYLEFLRTNRLLTRSNKIDLQIILNFLIMKRLFLLIAMFTFMSNLIAQEIPNGINYQAVIRDASGNIISNKEIALELSIQNNIGTDIWTETHTVTTNQFGLVSLVVGQGTPTSGTAATFGDIDWSAGPLKLLTIVTYNSQNIDMGSSYIWAVPYSSLAREAFSADTASYATEAGNAQTAGEAVFAQNAGTAENAVNAQNATLAQNAENAQTAITALTADVAYDLDGELSSLNVVEDIGGAGIEPLFEVKNNTGQTVFAVYNEGVEVYFDDSEPKGIKGSFAVRGFSTGKEGENDYLFVNRDSARIYLNNDDSVKGIKGSFAVGSFYTPGMKAPANEYLRITEDSSRIYINDAPEDVKGIKGSFAVQGFKNIDKGEGNNYFDISMDQTNTVVNPAENRILWYPQKNAFLTGKVLIEDQDSVGVNSFASGFESKAPGDYSQALGYQAIARGNYSTSIGVSTIASGTSSFSLGDLALASGDNSYAFGKGSTASGNGSYAFGFNCLSSATSSISMGNGCISNADYTFSAGKDAEAKNTGAIAIGNTTTATGLSASAFGYSTNATGDYSIASGYNTTSGGVYSTAMGYVSNASATSSIAIGHACNSSVEYATAIGRSCTASAQSATAIGYNSTASGTGSIAFGTSNVSSQFYATCIGFSSTASGQTSTAIGRDATASATNSVAMGYLAEATNTGATAVGYSAEANGQYAFGGGYQSNANGYASVALGNNTTTSNNYSTAIGFWSEANAHESVSIGSNTVSTSYACFVAGRLNEEMTADPDSWVSSDPIFIIGNGQTTRHNAVTVLKNGYFGIGTTAPTHILHIAGVGRSTQSTWATSSDMRVKNNIKIIENGLEKILKLKPVSFQYTPEYIEQNNGYEGEYLGFIAQDVKEVLPQLVYETSEKIGEETINDFLLLNQGELIPVMVEAIKEQQTQIESQNHKIEDLERLIFVMQEEIASLKEE